MKLRTSSLPLKPRSTMRGVLLFAGVAGGYVAGYKLASTWFSAEDQGASFFPAAGVTLAALVLLPRHRWPIVLAAAAASEIVLDLVNGTGLLPSMGYALANTIEPFVGAALLTGVVASVDLRRTRDLAAFITCAVVIAPAVGGIVAATTFVYVDDHSGWARFAFEWWSGDGLGVLVVGSAILSLRFARLLTAREWLEATVFAVLAIASTVLVFDLGWFEFVYLPAAILVVVAFRVGTTGVAVTAALVAFVAAGATAEAQDFWAAVDVSPANRILYLQLSLAVIVGSVLALAAEIAQRERIAVDLARAESERRVAVERATLAESEQVAHARTARLQALTASLAAAASVKEVAEAVTVHGVAMLQADAGFVAVPADDRTLFEIVAAVGWDPEVIESWSPYPAELAIPVTRAASERNIVLVESLIDAGASEYPVLAQHDYPGLLADRAGAVAPLIATTGRLLGVVYVAFHRVRTFEESERQMLQALASQGALALERAVSFEHELDARRRAELLERHVGRLGVASSVSEVAQVTLSGLEEIGVDAAWVQRVRNGNLEVVGHTGAPEESLAYPLHGETPPTVALRTGAVVVVGNRTELDRRYPAARQWADRLGLQSMVSVPLRTAGGRIVGALSVTSSTRRWFDDSRGALITALAEQCGLALERAELQEAADAAAQEAALMAYLGETLERMTTVAERARILVRTLTSGTATLAVVHLLDDDGRPQQVARASSGAEERAWERDAVERLAVSAVSSGRHEQVPVDGLDLLAVPLRARNRALGVLTMGTREGRDARMTSVLGQRIATRAALALDNALLYEQERDVSHSLQLGLLGGPLETVPGAEVATAYRAAASTLEVGGDWYDAFTLPDGRLTLLVGDVVGHGLEAAVAMGQLRGAVRALAPIGSPREVLGRLDDFVDTLPEAGMATLAYAELDLGDGTITYACAGHPPPLLVPATGDPRLLWNGRSVPLGSSIARDREEAVDRLSPGDTIVLYTDGLVERRRNGISAGFELLMEAVGGADDAGPAELVETILDTVLAEEEQDDDVCILAVRFVAAVPRFERAFTATPGAVGTMRRELAGWLEQVGVDAGRRLDAVLAASEAAANAAEHAYGFDGNGLIRVEARLVEGELRLSVRDEGTWREPRRNPERGRGLTIMEALMHTVAVDRSERGTTVRMSMPATEEVSVS